jgi:chorismate mutase
LESEEEKMVVLVVATTSDPASIGPAAAFLAMPGWSLAPPIVVRTKQSLCLNPIYLI